MRAATRHLRAFLVMLVALPAVVDHAHAQVNPLWDHYRVYARVQGSPVITGPNGTLEDQFGISSFQAPTLLRLQNPDQKTHDGTVYPIHDQRLHYLWWLLPTDNISRSVVVSNQFGASQSIVINAGSLRALLNPALKDETGPLPVANHYKCYSCTGIAPNATVQLQDQYTTRTAVVAAAAWLCNPAKKTVEGGATYDIVDPAQHYVCYSIGAQAAQQTPTVTDQFIPPTQMALLNNLFLCVPSTTIDPTSASRDTWGRIKTVYR